MAKSNVNEAQIKARSTSLGKKTKEELINIILRKDSTERKNNKKISELNQFLKTVSDSNEEKTNIINNLKETLNNTNDIVNIKQEQIDNLIQKNVDAVRKYDNIVDICNFRRKVLFCNFGVIGILIIAIIILSILMF